MSSLAVSWELKPITLKSPKLMISENEEEENDPYFGVSIDKKLRIICWVWITIKRLDEYSSISKRQKIQKTPNKRIINAIAQKSIVDQT